MVMLGEGRRQTWSVTCGESFRGMKSSLWAWKVQCPEMMEQTKVSATLGSVEPHEKAGSGCCFTLCEQRRHQFFLSSTVQSILNVIAGD